MRRRSQVGLVLAGTLPLMLAGCGGSAPDTYTLSKTMSFPSVAECAQAGFSANVCASAFISARNDYERTTPEYDSKQACEDDFVPDYCVAKTVAPTLEEQTLWRPRMNGFTLNVEGELSEAQVNQAKQEAAASGHANDNQLLEGILLGYLLKSGMQGSLLYGPAQPTYLVRDPAVQPQPNTSTGNSYSGSSYSASRYGGGMRSSTLGEQVERGQHYSQSRQSQRYGNDYYHRPSTLGQSLRSSSSSSGLSRHAASSSTSRGGFGSQSSARGGWSGHSSSHGS